VLSIFDAVLIIAMLKLTTVLAPRIGWWVLAITVPVIVWIFFLHSLLESKVIGKYGDSYYKKEGEIELASERVPIWTWVVYVITFVGPAVLSVTEVLSVQWALVLALVSFGVFILYLGKKHKEMALGIVFGTLSLLEALSVAVGVPSPFMNKGWDYSYFAALMIYIIGAGFVTMVIVHIYNRIILRKIKQAGLFCE